MLFLIENILPHFIQVAFTHTHSPIIVLPDKFILYYFIFIDPKRRFSLNELSYFTYWLIFAQGDQAMSMFCISIDAIKPYLFFFSVLFDMLKELFSYF